MMNKNIKPKIAEDIVWKEEGEKGEIVSLASYLGGSIQLLNPVASKIIKLADGTNTIQDIIDNICTSFEEANPKRVEKDIESFLTKLNKSKILETLKES